MTTVLIVIMTMEPSESTSSSSFNQSPSGDKLSNDKLILQFDIGSGGFAQVFCGVLQSTNKSYAVKIVNTTQFSDTAKQMLLSEWNALKRLAKASHPFIANLHFAFNDGYVYWTIS